jgi:hypothetical protein
MILTNHNQWALDPNNALNCGKINKKNLEMGSALDPNQRRFDFFCGKKLRNLIAPPLIFNFVFHIIKTFCNVIYCYIKNPSFYLDKPKNRKYLLFLKTRK